MTSLLRRGWDGLSIYLPVLLMALLALGTWWLVRNAPAPQASPVSTLERPGPDYFMNHFSVQNFGASGQLESEIYGQAARHYPDSDTLEIDKMRMHSVATNGQATRASADRALSNADGSEVQLFGHAVVIREPLGATQPPLEFRGDFLHIWPRKEQVRSNQPVSLARGKDHFTADTLEYDHGSQVLQLQGHVRGVLMPGH